MHRTKAIDILQVSFIHIHMCRYTKPNPVMFYKYRSYTVMCRDIQSLTINTLQVSFMHIHMWRCMQPKPLLFYKCHSYTFTCGDARNQSHWYFTSVIHTHSYAKMNTSKPLVSCINEWISLDNLSYLAIQIRTMVTTFQNWDIVIQYQYIYWWLKLFAQETLLPTSFHNHADPDFFPW